MLLRVLLICISTALLLELLNAATGVRVATESSDAGTYRFINVLPGRYQLTATLAGFQTGGVQNLAVEINKTATVNLTLVVGQVSTTVEVSDAAATIDTTTATIGSSFTSTQALQLPTSGLGTLGVMNLALLNAVSPRTAALVMVRVRRWGGNVRRITTS
jgi:hypothetical protein